MTNIRYIISKWPIKEEGIRLVYAEDELFIYENPGCLARTFFVENFKVIKDRKGVLRYIFSESFNPAKEVVLEESGVKSEKLKVKSEKLKTKNERRKTKIIKYEPNRVVIDVSAPADGFLFLSDTYYPGWRASIDGKKAKIYRANYCFRAVKIPKGDHLIEMRFLPKSFVIGLAGSILSLIFITIVMVRIRLTKDVTLYSSEEVQCKM
ncbi:MAG: YfhO family protein, partial [bacterium]|nr:YfhO family protein [bacterium]